MGFLVGKPMHHTSSLQSIETISERCMAKAGNAATVRACCFPVAANRGFAKTDNLQRNNLQEDDLQGGDLQRGDCGGSIRRNQVPAIVLVQHRTTRLKSNPCSKSRHHLYFALERLKIKP
jgi:hypothetical protein